VRPGDEENRILGLICKQEEAQTGVAFEVL
jgi:hypothetical protein